MWKDKKFYIVIGVVILAIVVGGVLGGIALTRTNDDGKHSIKTEVLEKVTDNFKANTGTDINPQDLKDAFKQAGLYVLSNALTNHLENLVKDSKITQEQADQFKAWLDARPDIPAIFGLSGNESTRFFGMMRNGNPGFDFRFRGH
jgi:hypothetical protein